MSAPHSDRAAAEAFLAELPSVSRAVIAQYFRQTFTIDNKADDSPVTIADRSAEAALRQAISAAFPGHAIVGEEQGGHADEGVSWIIDPIDGTTNFVHGLPCFAISIALQQKNKTILGLVHEMNLRESFYAYEGGEAYLNGNLIQVSKTKDLNQSLIATGFPYSDYGKTDPYLEVFKEIMQKSRGLRRLGSAATDLVYVAAGRFEAFYEYGLSPWDVAAGGYILQKAGGLVTEFSGKEDYIFGKTLIASNNFVYDELKEIINKYF
jgi:myo-inositol-1(or 4)-monophosphatase